MWFFLSCDSFLPSKPRKSAPQNIGSTYSRQAGRSSALLFRDNTIILRGMRTKRTTYSWAWACKYRLQILRTLSPVWLPPIVSAIFVQVKLSINLNRNILRVNESGMLLMNISTSTYVRQYAARLSLIIFLTAGGVSALIRRCCSAISFFRSFNWYKSLKVICVTCSVSLINGACSFFWRAKFLRIARGVSPACS